MPIVNCVFGPGTGVLLWMDVDPGEDKRPKYRSSSRLPNNLLGRLHGRHPHIKRLHSVAIDPKKGYAASFVTTTQRTDAVFDLSPEYKRLKDLLIDAEPEERGSAVFNIGPDGDYFTMYDSHVHCRSKNTGLEDEVYNILPKDIATVALGVGQCGLILDKSHEVVEHGLLSVHYPTLYKDIRKYMDSDGQYKKKAWSVALNPFVKDEYFIAFTDHTFCYNSEALGGHCEPPAAGATYMAYTIKTTRPATDADWDKQRIEVLRCQEFENLMNEWNVKPLPPPGTAPANWNRSWSISQMPGANNSTAKDPIEWLHAPKLETPQGTQPKVPQSNEDWGVRGRVYGD